MASSANTAAQSSRAAGDPRQTPAMRQYFRFKEQYPDCILLFRMGDFYEMFDRDAELAHKALGVTLTQRTAGVPMAGVPYHAVESYLRRLIEAGYRVAVCDQMQDASEAKGVIERAVTRVITPGTLVDESLLDDAIPNLVGAIQFHESGDHSGASLALAELSTGSFHLIDLPGGRVVDELVRLGPTELLHVETADGHAPRRVEAVRVATSCALTPRPAWTFRMGEATDCLKQHFGVTMLDGFGLADDDLALGPAGALLRYLKEMTGGSPALRAADSLAEEIAHGSQRADAASLAHLRPPRREAADQYVIIDASSLRSLEVERTMRSGQTDGSLLSVLQRCRTAMGKRLLRQWLCFPLRDLAAIERRQDAVATFLADHRLWSEAAELIAGVQDVSRIAGRMAMGRATPRDLVALGQSAARSGGILQLLANAPSLAPLHARMLAVAPPLESLSRAILEKCSESPPPHLRDGGMMRDGVDAELDEARLLQRDATTWLAAYQKRLIEQTSIQSLKVGYNKIFGYYIQITNAHADRIPEFLRRQQTLKNAERYVTPELKEFEDKVTTAEARAIEREKLLFERLCKQAAAQSAGLSEFADIVAELDVLLSFADAARRFDYVRPQLVMDPMVEVVQGRHPVLDRILGERFVPNDCNAGRHEGTEARRHDDGAQASLALITGPNMAGKSTFIRQVALITLMAHTGSFVPAERATIGLVDRIFTRIGASDELHSGQSTFMVEMTETANILHHATPASLVILDEIGRGTSTLDGLSLAWAIAETLADRGCRTLFATHYHELTTLADRLPAVMNLHVAVREWADQIIFLYRILPGRTDRSYGIHVAKIAGVPPPTIRRAGEILDTLAVQTEGNPPVQAPSAATTGSPGRAAPSGGQLSLFTEYVQHPVVDELRKAELDHLSPIQAFDLLRRLKEQAER